MPQFDWRGKIIEHLRANADKKLTAREITEALRTKYPEEFERKKKESRTQRTDESIFSEIASRVNFERNNCANEHKQFKIIEGRPRRYYWTEKEEEDTDETGERGTQPVIPSPLYSKAEQELYDPLRRYLASEWNVLSMCVEAGTSSNRDGSGSNKWLHPDIVGMEDLTSDWGEHIKTLTSKTNGKRARLWSLEVKTNLTRSTVRDCFFQAIANSSWANVGYLAVTSIDGGEKTMKELRMLANLHGIGLIIINKDSPEESVIRIPARERRDIDWATCNRVAKANEDFGKFIKAVQTFFLSGSTDSRIWDIPEPEDEPDSSEEQGDNPHPAESR